MKRHLKAAIVALITGALTLPLWAGGGTPIPTTFTYQGMLKVGGAPYNGTADVQVRLYDSATAGTQVGGAPLLFNNVIINGGTFTVGLDWGASVFDTGGERWLQIEVRTPAGSAGTFTTLSPRQRLTPVPYAMYALYSHTPFEYYGSDAVYLNGSVGVGTASPQGRMHVRNGASGGNGIGGSTLVLESNANQYLSMLATNSAESGILFGRPGSSNPAAAGGIVYNNFLVQDGLDFRTGGNQTRMVITGDGKVGIGTNVPGSGLHVLSPQGSMNAVQGANTATSGAGTGSGVVGFTAQSSYAAAGVRGANTSSTGTGVIGSGNASIPATLAGGGGGAFTGLSNGVYAKSTTANVGEGLLAEQYSSTVRVAYWNGSTFYKINGNGAVSTLVRDAQDKPLTMFAPEAPEVLFNDYGRGALVNGFAHIDLDPDFARNVVISAEHPLRVFIQLEDNETCEGVIVKNKTAAGFDVVELRGGHSNTPFQYQITCNRADEALPGGRTSRYADLRFPPGPQPVAHLTEAPDSNAGETAGTATAKP